MNLSTYAFRWFMLIKYIFDIYIADDRMPKPFSTAKMDYIWNVHFLILKTLPTQS